MMKDEDAKLSNKISPRGRIPSEELRQLMVNRLSDTYKAVLRRSLRRDNISMYCEDCGKWTTLGEEYPQTWTCRHCETAYRIEFAVYEEMEKGAE